MYFSGLLRLRFNFTKLTIVLYEMYILYLRQVRFRGVEYSLISTAVMMIGEMEYTDLFFGTEDVSANTPEFHRARVYYEVFCDLNNYIVFLQIH